MIYILGLIVVVALFFYTVQAKGIEERRWLEELRSAGYVIDDVFRLNNSMIAVDRKNRKAAFYNCSSYLDTPVKECWYPFDNRSSSNDEFRFVFDDIIGAEIQTINSRKYTRLVVVIKIARKNCRPSGLGKKPECSGCCTVLSATAHEILITRLTKLLEGDFGVKPELSTKTALS